MLDACKVLASPIRNVKIIKLAKITIVLTRAQPLADKELIAAPTTTLQSVDAQEATLEIPSKHAEDLPRTRSVKHVVPTQIARSGKMTLLSASVNKIMSVTHCKDVGENVILHEIVRPLRNVNDLNVYLCVEKAYVARMQIARLEIIVQIALVLLIFSEMVTPGVTPNVQNTTIAHKTKPA